MKDVDRLLTTDVSSLWEIREDRAIGPCFYCSFFGRPPVTTDIFPGICSVCCQTVFGVRVENHVLTGKTLVSTRATVSGVLLFEYEGELISHTTAVARYGHPLRHASAPYLQEMIGGNERVIDDAQRVYVDAQRYRGLAAFVDHASQHDEHLNCRYRLVNGKIFVESIREIQEGERVLVCYGPDISFG